MPREDRSDAYFRNTIDALASKAGAAAIDACAGTSRKPHTGGQASVGRVWTDDEGREWRIVVSISAERVR